jgi:multicomponent Na+:H+ antiporter subunit D
VWGIVFHIAAFLAAIYAWHVRSAVEHASALVYAGAAIAGVFAGDLVTLFVAWELTAISSEFLVWASGGERALRAGMRYLIVQVGSGVLLLAGALLRLADTGSLAFDHLGLGSTATLLVFLAFGIKCAFPLLHNWLQDAYPEATVTGTVFLSAFTTKLAVYALARGFAGVDALVWIGAAMTAFPIFYAVIENDLRRVLAYSLNNQLGFMVAGVGIGTELALNGTAAHAFTHILYKALLFMSMGAVLHRTGTAKGSELGGLYRSMPWTTAFCIVGAASISAFPLFSGFVSKSLILTAAAEEHRTITFLVLLFASAGVFHHSGIKIPYFAFFAHDSGIRCREAPFPMLLAMGLAAACCVGLGVWPGPLYAILPFPVVYDPYTWGHVVTQLQLLCFSALAFGSLQLLGLYPPELRSTNLDWDWTYRRAVPAALGALERAALAVGWPARRSAERAWTAVAERVVRHHVPAGTFARSMQTGSAVLWVTLLLTALLVAYYLGGP